MTLKQLEAFYWAATCLNFSVAALRVHVSISSLSKRINELENSLGQVLFDRSGHKASLTDAGLRLLPKAHELLQAAHALRLQMSASAGLQGVCRFGVGELTALTWLPRLVALIHASHPGLVLEPQVNVGEVLEQGIQSGQLDFAVVAGQSSRSGITSQGLAEAHFVWCMAAQGAPSRKPFDPGCLKTQPLVTLPAGSGVTRLVGDWLRGQGATPDRHLQCNHWGAVAGLIAQGTGVGVLPQGWAQALSRRGVVHVLRSEPRLPALPYSMQTRRDDSRPLVALLRPLVEQSVDFSKSSLWEETRLMANQGKAAARTAVTPARKASTRRAA